MATLERWDDAARLLELARREHERMGARPWLAFTLRDQARLRLARPSTGRALTNARADAHALRSRALDLAREIGMDGFQREIRTEA